MSAHNLPRWVAISIGLLAALLPIVGLTLAQNQPPSAAPMQVGVFVDNGTVQLGVNDTAELNVDGGPASPISHTTVVGLRYLPTGDEGIGFGYLLEGWGVADVTSGVTGWASQQHGHSNLTVKTFDSTASTAQSVVDVGSTFSVTHNFHPSSSPNLYQVDVAITNTSATTVELRYRRVVDWDVEPTVWNEYVTIERGNAANLIFTSNDGFALPDPLNGPSDRGYTGNFADVGPSDQGALFDLDLGVLASGASRSFKLYLGAAGTEAEAIAALSKVQAEAYSFGQPSTPGGPTLGTPNTFIMAFAGIGGTPLFGPVALLPARAYQWNEAGSTVIYTQTLVNATGAADSFNLDVSGNAWPTTLSLANTGVISSGAGVTFTVQITIPATMAGATDFVTLTATSVNSPSLSSTALLSTTALCSPRQIISGQSAQAASLDDIYNFSGQSFTYLSINAHATSGSNSMDATLLGYAPASSSWQTITHQALVGPHQNLITRWDVPPIYTALRVQLNEALGYEPVYYDYQFTVCRNPIVDLRPEAPQHGYAGPGEVHVYTYTLTNGTLGSAQFNLSVAGHVWPTTIHDANGTIINQTPVLADRDTYTFTIWSAIPANATPDAADHVTLTASSVATPTIQGTAMFTTTALCNSRQTITGQSGWATRLNDTYAFNSQGLTHIAINAHATSGNHSMDATLEGYDPGSAAWQTLAQFTQVGPDVALIDRWDVPPIYTAMRVQLHETLTAQPVYYDYEFTVCRHPIVDLRPDAPQRAYAQPDTTQVTTYTLLNGAEDNSSFNLSLAGNAWPTTLYDTSGAIINQTPVLADLAVYTFTVWTAIPNGTPFGAADHLTVIASGTVTPTIVDTATLTTYALSGKEGYIFDSAANLIRLIDPLGRIEFAAIDPSAYGSGPWRGSLSPDGRWLYVTLNGDGATFGNQVVVISTTTQAPAASLAVGTGPHGLAFSADGRYAYVANQVDGTVSVIDTRLPAVISTVPTGPGAQSIASSACLNKVYVANHDDDSVSVIDAGTGQVVKTIYGLSAPWGVVLSPYGNRAYVTNQTGGSIGVIDADNDTLIGTWSIGGWSLAGLDLSPDGRTLYVADSSQNVVFAVNASTGGISAAIPTGYVWDVQVLPAALGPYAYASDPVDGSAQMIDINTNSVVGSIGLGGQPRGLALYPPGLRTALCANLEISKSAQPNPLPAPGQALTYTLAITHIGGLTATNVIVTDVLPVGVTFGLAQASQGTCSGISTVVCQLGTLNNGAAASVKVIVTPTIVGTYVNTTTVTAAEFDPQLANNTAVATVGVGTAEISLAKVDPLALVWPGDVITYTFYIANHGPHTAYHARLNDSLPGGVNFNLISTSRGACSGTSAITCDLGDLSSGEAATVTLETIAALPGLQSNSATAQADQFDPILTNNIVTMTTMIIGQPEADFTAAPTRGLAPLIVNFTDHSTNVIDTWLWDFGDTLTSTVQNPTHTYTTAGTYPVTLTVGGPGGSNTLVKDSYIALLTQDDPITGLQAFNDSPTQLNAVTTLTVAISSGTSVTYTWTLGDGQTADGNRVGHRYTQAGVYAATVTATNSVSVLTATTMVVIKPSQYPIYLPLVKR